MSRIAAAIVLLSSALLFSCSDDAKKPPPDVGPPTDSTVQEDASTCGGTLGYLAACTTNEMCTSCFCKSFGHSQICTKMCNGPQDCPAPSGGCTDGACRP